MTDYSHLFSPFRRARRPAEMEFDAQMHIAAEALEFANTAFYPKFIAWLEREALKPLKIGNEQDMIQSAVRANTLREVRDTLVKQIEAARAAMMEPEER